MNVPRRGGLPEEIEYRVGGCRVHGHCLTCPLPACVYDAPRAMAEAAKVSRAREVERLMAGGLGPTAVAAELGVSRRTVFRIRRALQSTHPQEAS